MFNGTESTERWTIALDEGVLVSCHLMYVWRIFCVFSYKATASSELLTLSEAVTLPGWGWVWLWVYGLGYGCMGGWGMEVWGN